MDIDQLIKILPKLVRENDTVKGAIISALSGVVATHEDIQTLMKAMDRRSEVVDRRFEVVDRRFEELIRSIKHLTHSVSRIESKGGVLFEKTVMELMKETLQLENISPEKIRKEILTDATGEIFFPNYSTDIDVLIEDSNTYLIEVKSTAEPEDVAHFIQNAKLFEKIKAKHPTQLILIALRISLTAKMLAESQQMRVIAAEEF